MSLATVRSTFNRFADLGDSLDRPPSRMQTLGNEMGAPGPAWSRRGGDDWMTAARMALRRGGDRAGIGVAFRAVNALLKSGQFGAVDRVLSTTDAASLPRALQLAVLTITFVSRDHLPARASFYDAVHQAIRQRGDDADLILRGLR